MRTFALLGWIYVMSQGTLFGQTQARFTVTVTKPEIGRPFKNHTQ